MKYILILLVLQASVMLSAQSIKEDVVYLKDGSIIRGVITEQNDEIVKIQTVGGSVFAYPKEEIEKINREKPLVKSNLASLAYTNTDRFRTKALQYTYFGSIATVTGLGMFTYSLACANCGNQAFPIFLIGTSLIASGTPLMIIGSLRVNKWRKLQDQEPYEANLSFGPGIQPISPLYGLSQGPAQNFAYGGSLHLSF